MGMDTSLSWIVHMHVHELGCYSTWASSLLHASSTSTPAVVYRSTTKGFHLCSHGRRPRGEPLRPRLPLLCCHQNRRQPRLRPQRLAPAQAAMLGERRAGLRAYLAGHRGELREPARALDVSLLVAPDPGLLVLVAPAGFCRSSTDWKWSKQITCRKENLVFSIFCSSISPDLRSTQDPRL